MTLGNAHTSVVICQYMWSLGMFMSFREKYKGSLYINSSTMQQIDDVGFEAIKDIFCDKVGRDSC